MIVKYAELRLVGEYGSDDNITYFDKMPTTDELIKHMADSWGATVVLAENKPYGIYFEYTTDYNDDIQFGDVQESSIHINTWN